LAKTNEKQIQVSRKAMWQLECKKNFTRRWICPGCHLGSLQLSWWEKAHRKWQPLLLDSGLIAPLFHI